MLMCLDVQSHDAELDFALLGAEEDDPVQPLPTIETNDVRVEASTRFEVARQNIRLDSLHSHLRILRAQRGHAAGAVGNVLRTNMPLLVRCRADERAKAKA